MSLCAVLGCHYVLQDAMLTQEQAAQAVWQVPVLGWNYDNTSGSGRLLLSQLWFRPRNEPVPNIQMGQAD